MNFLARGPYCWGTGTTREAAVKNAAKNFPRSYFPSVKRVADKHFSIYTSEGQFSIDDAMGSITSTKADIQKLQTSCLADED